MKRSHMLPVRNQPSALTAKLTFPKLHTADMSAA